MEKLLSLDQASHTSGWAFFEDGKLSDYGKFTVKDKDIGDRLYTIRENIKTLIDKYQINKVIFEDIQLQDNVGENVKTFKILAEVFGVVYELVSELNISNDSVLAIVWKASLGIEGRTRTEQKKNAQKYVLKNFNLDVTQDEADAICIGCYAQKQNEKKELFNIEPEGFDWSD